MFLVAVSLWHSCIPCCLKCLCCAMLNARYGCIYLWMRRGAVECCSVSEYSIRAYFYAFLSILIITCIYCNAISISIFVYICLCRYNCMDCFLALVTCRAVLCRDLMRCVLTRCAVMCPHSTDRPLCFGLYPGATWRSLRC